MKSKEGLRWPGQVAETREMNNAHRILVGKILE
jgi:hypothetical protein